MTRRAQRFQRRDGTQARGPGFREDLGCSVRSSWEGNYFRFLLWLKERGRIHDFAYEPFEFWFCRGQGNDRDIYPEKLKGEGIRRGVRSYKPDFIVMEHPNAKPHIVEVKGWLDPESKTKLRRMAKYFPEVEVRLFDGKQYRALKKWAALIPNWE